MFSSRPQVNANEESETDEGRRPWEWHETPPRRPNEWTESTARPLGEQNAVRSQAPAERTVGVGAHFRDADMRNVSE